MLVRRALLALALLLVPVGASAFDAQTLAGTWVGTWKNLKFKGVGGPFTIVITAPDADTIVVDASGANFGCGALATPVTLKQGTDWIADGAVGVFDTINLIFEGATRRMVGLGTNCHGDWAAKGRVNKKLSKFNGKSLTITSSGPAKSKIKAKRQS